MTKQKLSILLFFIGLFSVFAQGPKSPEASSFEPIDAADMVNLLTGDFTYVLPVINVPSPEGGYPLALSYHSGIAMGQEASWVGLGWNINPGAINRNVSGLPDDWLNTRKYVSIYDQGGTVTNYSGGVGLNIYFVSVGLYFSYAENKSFGGENSYDFDLGTQGSVGANGFGVGNSVGLSGASVFGRVGPIGVSASKSYKNGNYSYGLALSGSGGLLGTENAYGGAGGSVGVSFNSSGTYLTSSVGSSKLSGNSSAAGVYSFRNDKFTVIAPFANFTYSRVRYWLHETDYTTFNGSLYAGKTDETLNQELFDWKVAFDSYESISSPNRPKEINNTNYSNIAFDKYSVSGQGLSGTIKPGVFEEGVLYHKQETIETGSNGFRKRNTSYFYPSTYNQTNGKFNTSIDENNSNRINFYFASEQSSYLKTSSGNWNTPGSVSYSNIFSFTTLNPNISSLATINGEQYDGYNSSNNRRRGGAFIETFTNNEINAALTSGNSIGFIEASNFVRDTSLCPNEGIGGYRITAADGKVYHYSLPVYQREIFSRSTKLDKNPNTQFLENSQLEPYATHWLLTAITGPDYVDINTNFKPDESDYGYWVEFEYGKWSDAFSWRNPPGDDFEKDLESKSYQWGLKDVYYLDKVKTRTHTALFIKEERKDNRSTEMNFRNGSQPLEYLSNYVGGSGAGIYTGDDGNSYFRGTYEAFQVPFPATSYIVRKNSKVFVETQSHKSLKLNKIIVVKNESLYANISKSNALEDNPIIASNIDLKEDFILQNTLGQTLNTSTEPIYDRIGYGQFYENVLDVNDVVQNAPDLENQAQQVVDFIYGYTLMTDSPNSQAADNGRLTLNSVNFKGKKGVSLIPPYIFDYTGQGQNYNTNAKDAWGYPDNAAIWNLNKIITPVGEVLNIQYEEDTFKEEAAIASYVFDKNFQMKFTGQDPGDKWVTFRNDPNNLPEQNINFNDYFEVGQSSRVNVHFVSDDTAQNAEERVADVDKICEITDVTSTTVTFKLPYQSVQNYERSQEICFEDNYVYFNWYSGSGNVNSVVVKSQNFVSEHKADECGEVSNSDRFKIQFFSSKPFVNRSGGGVRVSNIELVNEENEVYNTRYDYNIPNTTTTSGITSFEPSKIEKEVKYISELPSPGVMYEYVTVVNEDISGNEFSKNEYHFNVLKPMQLTNDGFNIDGFLELTKTQNSSFNDVTIQGESSDVKFSKFKLTNNLSALGRLIHKKTFNEDQQLISETKNSYKSNTAISQGIVQESYKTYKKVNRHFTDNNPNYFLSSSTSVYYPNIVESSTTVSEGYKYETNNKTLDFLTGQVTEIETISSDGFSRLQRSIPAYTRYSTMGPKVDNLNNKNMLSQEAMNYSFIDVNGVWKPIGVGLQTWNNEWVYTDFSGNNNSPTISSRKIWRKHRNYVWDGTVNSNGVYNGYNILTDDGFNWSPLVEVQPEPWKLVAETKGYNHYSIPTEVRDVNENFASTKMTDKDSKVLLTSNATYGEAFYSGFEYISLINNFFDQQIQANYNYQTADKAHTGSYSLKLNSGDKVTIKDPKIISEGKYKVSVWVHKDNYTQALINFDNTSYTPFNGEKIFAGNWVQLNHYYYSSADPDISELLTTTSSINIKASSGTIYLDDLRMHPIESSLTSYVYNEFDELSFVLGANNMASKYQYDEAGRLISVYQETANTATIVGGFKRAQEYKYNYKSDLVGPVIDPEIVSFQNIVRNDDQNVSTADLIGPAGTGVTYSIDCIGVGASAIVTLVGVGELGTDIIYNLTGGEAEINRLVVIPSSGIIPCQIHHTNSNPDNQESQGNITLMTMEDVSPHIIGTGSFFDKHVSDD